MLSDNSFLILLTVKSNKIKKIVSSFTFTTYLLFTNMSIFCKESTISIYRMYIETRFWQY